ncbi:hypothetical protein [Actinomadura rupiterrae]|uniref:hypothetical protein n=1 Tax=Actinomadura rupiterrae TaxID=559627 RepID=UPI0020A4627B|nr:hypothetical protein [Actinomadura rupiterrae]MCP2338225.1 hypothetical protein [Actinomadura rupiterrae]
MKRELAAMLLVGVTAAGCGSHGSPYDSGHGGMVGGSSAQGVASIEQLAARTGCSLTGTRRSEQLQQGACRTSQGRYTLVGFDSDRDRDAWLGEAKPWGGSYLVGTRWVAVGTPATLEALRARLGGMIMSGSAHQH